MADFGKLNFSVAFNPTSAFPLDARSYFESLTEAQAAAASAGEVGSTNTVYHYGQKLLVKEGDTYKWYEIGADKTLKETGVYMRYSGGYVQFSTNKEDWVNVIAASELKGDKGDKGDTGAKGETGDTGAAGPAGADGLSPTVTVEVIDGGHRVSITDINGTKNFDVYHGNGINEYELTYYDTEPTESQQLLEKATILTIMNDTADHIVYINYDDGKHPASIYQYGGAIYFYFIHPNEKCWFEISYFPDTDFLQYGKFSAVGSGGECNLPEIAERTETELISSPDANFTYDSFYGWHMYSVSTVLNLTVGDKCRIVWDTDEYYCTVVDVSSVLTGYNAMGNLSEFAQYGFSGNNEPFIIAFNDEGTAFAAINDTAPGTHSFAIYKIGVSADEGKFLQVIDGKAAWVTIELAEDGGF